MENEFIHYEQALKLKQLGFKEDCLAYYVNTDNFRLGKFPSSSEFANNKNYKYGNLVSIPLYQQAFRWFREKYHIIGYPIFKGGKTTETSWYDYIIYSEIDWEDNNPNQQWKTYEEAELECLRKLIEIVKNK